MVVGPVLEVVAGQPGAGTARPVPSPETAGPKPPPAAPQVVTATFQVSFAGGMPAPAQAAVQRATAIWSELITSSVPIRVEAEWVNLGSPTAGGLATAPFLRDFPGAALPGTFYPETLAEALSGTDLNPGSFDIQIDVNSARTDWYFGTDGQPPANLIDMVSVVLHELGHGLGFLGSMNVVGSTGSWGLGAPAFPTVFDRFAQEGGGTSLLNTATYPNPSTALGNVLRSNSVYFSSFKTNASSAGRPQLWAPATWSASSFQHLDDNAYPPTGTNALMTPTFTSGEADHGVGPLAQCILEALGWATAHPCAPGPIPDVVGFTWYSDGASAKSGATGTVVRAYATGAARNTSYRLVTAQDAGSGAPCTWDPVPVNANVRTSNNLGFIGNTTGPINRGIGPWQLCFYEIAPNPGGSTTAPARFTVV